MRRWKVGRRSPPPPSDAGPLGADPRRAQDFGRVWAAATISQLGSQVTLLALPLTALLTLHAGAFDMGVLATAESAPWLIVGLPAGAWVDRWSRRTVLVVCDVGRAVLLVTAPGLALTGALRIEWLWLIGFGVGCLNVFFGAAAAAYLPALVDRERLVQANSRLEGSRAVAEVVGPAIGGWLVQVLSAPIGLLVDALSFLASGALIATTHGPSPERESGRLVDEVVEGVRALFSVPVLRASAIASGIFNFFDGMLFSALYLLYVTRDLGVSPQALGLLLTVGGLGGVAGAIGAERLGQRFSIERILIAAALLAGAGSVLIPLAAVVDQPVVLLALAELIVRSSAVVFGITATSLRQAVTPEHLLGRVSATTRVLTWGSVPLGALLGGVLGGLLGVPQTVALGAAGTLLAGLWLLASPIRSCGSSDHRAG